MDWFVVLLAVWLVLLLLLLGVLIFSMVFGTRYHECGHAVMIWAVPCYRPVEIGITTDRGYCSFERSGLTIGSAQSLASAATNMAGIAAEDLARSPILCLGYGSDLSSALRDVRRFLALPLANRISLLNGVSGRNMRLVSRLCRFNLHDSLTDDELRGMTLAYEMALDCLRDNWARVRTLVWRLFRKKILLEAEITTILGTKPRHISYKCIRL